MQRIVDKKKLTIVILCSVLPKQALRRSKILMTNFVSEQFKKATLSLVGTSRFQVLYKCKIYCHVSSY